MIDGNLNQIFNAKMTASISFSLYLELMVIHTLTSSWKKPFGICSICSSESKSVGSSGRNCWRVRFAALSRLSKRGRLGERASVSSLRSTSLTTSHARLKTSSSASCLTRHLIFAATIPPTGACSMVVVVPPKVEDVTRSFFLGQTCQKSEETI